MLVNYLLHPNRTLIPMPQRILAAVAAVLAALLLRLLLTPIGISAEDFFFLFFTAVVFSAWYGGLGPSVLATLLSALVVDYFFVPPTGALLVKDPAQTARILIFIAEGLAVGYLTNLSQQAYQQAKRELDERQKAERRLRESEERFRLLVERVEDYAIFMLSADGYISTWNVGAERIKGYTATEIIGHHYRDMFLPEDVKAGKPERLLAAAAAEGHIQDQGWRKRKDGTKFWGDAVITALRNEQGILTGYSKVTRDLTERRDAEESLKAMLRAYEEERVARVEAEKADALKLQFLAMISHELRTPLTSIKGFASTLLASDVEWDSEQQYDFITIMDSEADKLTGLIEQLLNLARLQAGTFSIEPTAHPLRTCLETAMPDLVRLTADHPLTISASEDLPLVLIDNARIAQVITNLVENAAKFSPPGLPIDITAACYEDMVQIDVRDHGPGIPSEERNTVFEAFRQVGRKTDQRNGAGLGLAIVKGIIEGHGGRIWIADTPPPGTTFSFTVPIAG